MLKLAVCDDNRLFSEEMKRILEKDERVESVKIYEHPRKLIEEITGKQTEFDAVFMDIEYGEKNTGMDYVEQIFRKNPEIQFIYVTGHRDCYEQYMFLKDSNLTGYLTKPVDLKLLSEYLDRILKKGETGQDKTEKLLEFSIRGKEYVLTTGSILYLESDNHTTIIHTQDRSYAVYDKLSNFYEKLPDFFIQCHKSYLVNMDKISYLEGNAVYLQDGQRIPVSRIHQKKVQKLYFSYLGKNI